MKSTILVVALILLAVPAFSQSTPGAGTFGIGTSISGLAAINAADIATVSNGLSAMYWVDHHIVLSAGFGLSTTSDVGTVFDFNFGGLYHFNKNQLSPLAGAAIFISVNSPSAAGAKSTTSFGFLLGGGAEYFFSKNFGMSLTEGIQFSTQPTTFAFVSKMGINWYF